MHLEWVSASEGPKFRKTVARVCRADQGAGPKSASRRGGIGRRLRYCGRRQVVRRPGFVF